MPDRHRLLTLVDSKGARIRVASGRVWITEDGARGQSVLERDAEYIVSGDGRVVIEQEAVDRHGAMPEVFVSRVCDLPAAWRRALGDF